MALHDTIHAWTYGGKPFLPLSKSMATAWAHGMLSLRMTMRQAKRFVLDDQFVAQVVRRSAVQPGKMINMINLANLPFDKIWVEYDNNARVDAQHAQGTGESRNGEERGLAGFLMERRREDNPGIFRICHAAEVANGPHGPTRDLTMPFGPVGYGMDVSGEDTLAWIRDATAYSAAFPGFQAKMSGMGWGYFAGDKENIQYVINEELNRRGIVVLEGRFFGPIIQTLLETEDRKSRDLIQEYFLKDVYEGRGNLRFITALLAMLNSCPIEYRHRPAKGYRRMRLRNVPYLDDHELIIRCGRKRIVNVVDEAIRDRLGGWHNRRHPVRGHWALAEKHTGVRACVHEAVERDGNYALCGKCQRLLVWIDHYERGDASLGYVDHTYKVKP